MGTPTAPGLAHDQAVRQVSPGRLRFWQSYLGLGFAVLTAETGAVIEYLLSSPHGPHRPLLIVLAAAFGSVGIVGLGSASWVARRSWRATFGLTWSVASIVMLAACAHLDGGLESPLLYLAVLPVMFASLALRPSAVGMIGAVTVTSVVLVGVSDSKIELPQQSITMFSAIVVGVTFLAFVSARHRTRLQADDDQLIRELAERSLTDALTGCRNHRAFHERLAEEVERAIRYERPLCLMICDVDFFKDFNDFYGHDVGDAALADVGAHLRANARSSDVVARIGGDEFAVLMPETSLIDGSAVAARILAAREEAPTTAALSVGVAGLDPSDPSARRLLRDADQAMYDAKAAGRGRVVTASQERRLGMPAGSSQLRHVADGKRVAASARQAHREKLETEMILDLVLHESPVGFAFADCDSRIIRINPALAALGGQPLADHVGRSAAELLPDLWPELEAVYSKVVDEGHVIRNTEFVSPASDGGERAWLVSLFPITVGGRILGAGLVVLDITDRKKLEDAKEGLTDAVITALVATVEARDPYTAGHQRRVAEIAGAIATELGYDRATTKGIALAAAIHDIGKVAVPAEILSRPARLSRAEMEIVRTHAEAGYNILKDIGFPWPVADMVGQHHERLDGSGYPRGLRDDQICAGARIIAVADVVEAMSAHRPYRAALGVDAALSQIQEGKGWLFDANVVEACTRLFGDGTLRAAETDVA